MEFLVVEYFSGVVMEIASDGFNPAVVRVAFVITIASVDLKTNQLQRSRCYEYS